MRTCCRFNCFNLCGTLQREDQQQENGNTISKQISNATQGGGGKRWDRVGRCGAWSAGRSPSQVPLEASAQSQVLPPIARTIHSASDTTSVTRYGAIVPRVKLLRPSGMCMQIPPSIPSSLKVLRWCKMIGRQSRSDNQSRLVEERPPKGRSRVSAHNWKLTVTKLLDPSP